VAGKTDPTGSDRRQEQDRGKPLAGKSTLNRLEWGAVKQDRYRKISLDSEAVDRFFVDVFLVAHQQAPAEIVLDLDATDDPLHGEQEGRFFHGYYGGYCYLPLYIFCGSHLLCARLREANVDASFGAVSELERIVERVREKWPEVRIIVRGDSGFAREDLMSWCESHGVDFVLGLARNARLQRALGEELEQARAQFEDSGKAARVFKDFVYRTRKSWSRQRRVVGKAEHLAKGANPRFLVTSLSSEQWSAQVLYEKLYCARGEMENRIKEQQLCLFADRTSTHHLSSNQARLWFSSVAYVLLNELRRLGLSGTELAQARCDTIRTKLLKIGAQVKVTVRRGGCICPAPTPMRACLRGSSISCGRAIPPWPDLPSEIRFLPTPPGRGVSGRSKQRASCEQFRATYACLAPAWAATRVFGGALLVAVRHLSRSCTRKLPR
jgi:hypothetical protein